MGSLKNDDAGRIDNKKGNDLFFHYLPAYASFIIENHLDDFTRSQLRYSREEEVPLLRFFDHLSEEELFEMSRKSTHNLLNVFVENGASQFIHKSAEDYIKNRIPSIESEKVLAKDITLISFVRRKALRKFLKSYTGDFELFSSIMEEVDRFVAESEAVSFNAYMEVQQEKISRINSELSLRQEELLEIQDLADMGSFFWNLVDGSSSYTPGVAKIFELEAASGLDSFLACVHEEDTDKVKAALDKAFSTDGIYECEYRYVKNNREKKIWSRGLVKFHEGTPVNMKGTIMDVSDTHRLLNQLQQSEMLNKQAQAITHIGNWTWDISSNEITWSDEMYRIYGLVPQSEKINFERFVSLIHPDDREKRVAEIQESLQTLHARDYLMRIVNPDGTLKILRGKGEVIVSRNIAVKLVGTCQDITREYNLNKELQEKEAYLQQLINNAPDSFIVTDENGSISLWNPTTEKMFGWTEEEVLGSDLSQIIIPPAFRRTEISDLKNLLRNGGVKNPGTGIEIKALDKKGREFDVAITVSKSIQQDKSVFIVFLRDITNEKQIKAELQNKTLQLEKLNNSLELKNTELERINKELESFNYVASHDLQEPLRKIQTFTSRILEKGKSNLGPGVSDYFDKIMLSAARMQLLIEDLLTFSRTTATENNFEICDMNQVLEDVKSILSQMIEERQVQIEAMTLPVVKAVPFQLQQLFLNLISNAIKYSRENSIPRIKISSFVVEGKKINDAEATPAQHYYELRFEDNGIGFEPEHAEKIFGLFQRLHNKDKYSGTGIGLAICKKIVQHHSGFISASGEPGAGAVFSVHFPKEARTTGGNLVN